MGIWLIRISVIYLVLGIALGMYMSITGDFALSSVHTHMLLLGWTTLPIAGLIYHIFPALARGILAKIQFVLFNIGIPIMMIGLIYIANIVIVSIGATITSIATLVFALNVLIGLRKGSGQ